MKDKNREDILLQENIEDLIENLHKKRIHTMIEFLINMKKDYLKQDNDMKNRKSHNRDFSKKEIQ